VFAQHARGSAGLLYFEVEKVMRERAAELR
jgi:hypothetical protein